jgi:hypothetical protein
MQIFHTPTNCSDVSLGVWAALGGLAVSVLATGTMGLAAAGSGPAEDGGFLWVIKIRIAHFLWRGSKAVGPTS